MSFITKCKWQKLLHAFNVPRIAGERSYRRIVSNVKENETTIEAVVKEEVISNIAEKSVEKDKCPLRSRGIQITYEDVLILNQFISSEGDMVPQHITGLCDREHIKVKNAIKMAQRANLLPGEEDQYTEKGKFVPKLNRYLTNFEIGSRGPIFKRGPIYDKAKYRVGDAIAAADAPRTSNKPIKLKF